MKHLLLLTAAGCAAATLLLFGGYMYFMSGVVGRWARGRSGAAGSANAESLIARNQGGPQWVASAGGWKKAGGGAGGGRNTARV